jgi:hypothetical protein
LALSGRLRRFDGGYRWFLFRSEPLRDETGEIVNRYGTNTDIDDRKRAEALLAGEKRLLEMVASGRPLSVVLNALCELVEATVSGCYCGIVLVNPSGTCLQHGAAPSLPPSTEGKALGSSAIYYAEPTTPTPQHQALIDQFTHIASIAVERARSEEALKRSEAFRAKAQRVSSTGGFSWHAATGKMAWSEEVYRIFELDPALPVTLNLIFTRLHPEDIPSFQEVLIRQRL